MDEVNPALLLLSPSVTPDDSGTVVVRLPKTCPYSGGSVDSRAPSASTSSPASVSLIGALLEVDIEGALDENGFDVMDGLVV